MRYKIWKASINEYRVLDTKTNEVTVHENLLMIDCRFKVDQKAYERAKLKDFKDTGKDNDYFAWIEAEQVHVDRNFVHYSKIVYYNPFKHAMFRDRGSKQVLTKVQEVVTTGNLLSYIR